MSGKITPPQLSRASASGAFVKVFTPQAYGAAADGSTDDTTAIQAAEAAARAASGLLYFPSGNYRITGNIEIACDVESHRGATIKADFTGIAVTVGVSATTTTTALTCRLPFLNCEVKPVPGWVAGTTGVRLLNLQSGMITIPQVANFETGIEMVGIGTGCVFNQVWVGRAYNNKRNLRLANSATGWCNDNSVFAGQFSHISNEGTAVAGTRHILLENANPTYSPPNGNRFIGGGIEGNVAEYQVECQSKANMFIGLRWEATSPTALFTGASAAYNQIIGGESVERIALVETSGAARNSVLGSSNEARSYAGGDEYLRVRNTNSNQSPVRRIFPLGSDIHDPDDSWTVSESSERIEYKASADAANKPRIRITPANGKILFGDGTNAGPFSAIDYVQTGSPGVGDIRISGGTGLDVTGKVKLSGALDHDGTTAGFYGAAPATKPTVTGSRGGNAALASLLTALATLGLITDSTTA